MEIFSTLGINGPLLIAQIVNFVIIAGVLTYFIYRPILNLIDARRESIRKSMEDVDRIQKQKTEMEEARRVEVRKIAEEGKKLLEQAKGDVAKEKDKMLVAARKEADDFVERGKRQLDAERTRMVSDVEKAASSLVIRLTQTILEREFTSADQDRLLKTLEKSISTPAHATK